MGYGHNNHPLCLILNTPMSVSLSPRHSLFALADCNNFYASCERVFQPHLKDKPIIVLSNNDGCIIARSHEAKKLGVPMGKPFFESRDLVERHDIQVFSSNYQLYGDMSRRVMTLLQEACPDLEVYSIDEAFLSLTRMPLSDPVIFAKELRQHIGRATGIPISIGLAPTKTLAKLANLIAKRQRDQGVFDLRDPELRDIYLKSMKVTDIWGISRRLKEKLADLQIYTAWDLQQAPPKQIRSRFNVVLERTVLELKGISCLSLTEISPRQHIMTSKSFGKAQTQLTYIENALCNYTARAGQKLRDQGSVAGALQVFLRPSPYKPGLPKTEKQKLSCYLPLPHPTQDNVILMAYAKAALHHIFKQGQKYSKTGILLLDLVPQNQQQHNLLGGEIDPVQAQKREKLQKLMDQVNQRMGQDTLFHGAQGIERPWQMRCEHRSPRYTTQWAELPIVHS